MAGDHKCPVCQATFTRPQHVARHMRSHTGDRPYKCQHCGDQFARSDLLSRHVNKCHAGDKPPTTTAPTRRKGLGASTRATTSKQACDQCVMSTLPCDGANPCSKCVQRKNPCTYVKFQRQTAPVGPGHKYNPSTDSLSSLSSGYSSSVPRADELFLVPPPMTVPSMGVGSDMLYGQQQFAFNPPPGAPMWDSDSPNPPSLTLSGATDSGPDASNAELASQYRHQGGHVLPGYTGAVQDGQGFYNHAQQSTGHWQVPADYQSLTVQQQQPHRKIDASFAQYLPQGASSAQIGPGQNLIHTGNFDVHGNSLYSLHDRRGSVDGFSDSGSVPSGPNSASSSSVHLPLEFGPDQQQHQQQQQQLPLDLLQYQQYNDGQPAPPSSRDGRFASSFGSLSLNDGNEVFHYGNPPNQEGFAPFFTQNALKLPPTDSTPRPFRADETSRAGQSATTPRDRDAEMRELREFWKQYLRTPLTGPGLGQTPKAELINAQLGALGDATRPTPKRGLSRVASLPSVRTPLEEKNNLPSRNANISQSQAQLNAAAAEDLKRYEEAILARKPLNLHFMPRKGRLSVSSSSVSPQPNPHQQQQPQQQQQHNIPNYSEPGPLAGLGQDAGDLSESESNIRPSFKRLPSQTLENTVQKRANFRWGSEEAYDDTDSEADGPAAHHTRHAPMGDGQQIQGSQGQRFDAGYRNMQFAHTESLLDRYRRQSAPTTMRPPPGALAHGDMGMKVEDSPSPPVDYSSPISAASMSVSPVPAPMGPPSLPPGQHNKAPVDTLVQS